MNIFFIMGKSGTGKSTIYEELLNIFGTELQPIVSHTTRPMRSGEENGKDYIFDSKEDYFELLKTKDIIESREYQVMTNSGSDTWYYCTVNDSQFSPTANLICIGTPTSYKSFVKKFGERAVCTIFIDVPDTNEQFIRMVKRERTMDTPNYKELCRRFLNDSEYSHDVIEECNIQRVFYNTNLVDCISSIERFILYKLCS